VPLLRSRRSWSLAAALLVGAVLACDSPAEPPNTDRRVAAGVTISASLGTDSVRTYSFLATAGEEYAVYFEAVEGAASITVSDSATGDVLGSVFDAAGGWGLLETATANFSRAGVLLIAVHGGAGIGGARFRFLIDTVNRLPETRPTRFNIGDTVSGESLDPIIDVDQFVATGQAGQELVGWIEALSPSGIGTVNMIVTDPQSPQPLGFVFHIAGEPPPLRLSALPPLPGARDYQFTVPVPRLPGYPQYTGAYRFRFYAINRGPESVEATIMQDITITGEALDVGGDIDEFTFAATAGQEFNAFIQSTAPSSVSLQPFGTLAGGSAVLTEFSDTGMFQHGTSRFKVVAPGGHGLRINGELLTTATGSYRLYLYRINRAPEIAPVAVSPGDTVSTETIELPGDVDEFLLGGSAGDEFNVFLCAQSPSPPIGVALDVIDPSDALLAATQTTTPDGDLLAISTGRFALPVSGTYRLRVDGAAGPYRFFVYLVDRRPESQAATLSFGDSVFGEAIDVPGDVDEFSVVVPDSSGANLVFRLGEDATSGTIGATLVRSGSEEAVAATSSYTPSGANQTGRFLIGPGSYVLRVTNADGPSPSRGSYRVWLYKFKLGPETVSDTIAVGDLIDGESLDAPGDLDAFHFYGTRGQHINIAIQGLGAPSTGGMMAFLETPTGGPLAAVVSPTSGTSLGAYQSLRLDLSATGWYRLRVRGASSPEQLSEYGPYRLAVTATSTAPEHVGDSLAPGDSVVAEQIDDLGDWDEYRVVGTPGQKLGIVFQSVAVGSAVASMVAFDSATGDTLTSEIGQGERLAGPVTIPAGGEVRIAVLERPPFGFRDCGDATCDGFYRFVGTYRVRVIPVNPAPESVPAAYTVGDTGRGESLFPTADVDEFTSSGTPGERLSAWWRLTGNPVPPGSLITLQVVDPATGMVLAGSGAALIASTANFIEQNSFTVPASGAFLVRVQGYGLGTNLGTAPYEFFVKRGP
jgi:hypothetical protein